MEGSSKRKVALMADGKEVPLVPFVEDFVAATVAGMLGALKGVDAEGELVLRIGRKEPPRG